ncbi:MAG: hypothetical protein GXZ11_07330 [Tissierellia bacterium]|nr:hypothetical protein [Tissierellia bacterium]
MKTKIKLYNVMFPVFFLLMVPITPIFLISILVNMIWDYLVFSFLVKKFRLEVDKMEKKIAFLKIFKLGFAADFIGAGILLAMMMGTKIGDHIGNYSYSGPIDQPVGAIIVFLAVVLSGVLLYIFNNKYTLKSLDWSTEDKKKVALWIAILTAPYTFLIPLNIFM